MSFSKSTLSLASCLFVEELAAPSPALELEPLKVTLPCADEPAKVDSQLFSLDALVSSVGSKAAAVTANAPRPATRPAPMDSLCDDLGQASAEAASTPVAASTAHDSLAGVAVTPPPGLQPPPGMPSHGSALHACGRCKPCAWFHKASGCSNGEECKHCHLCPEGELKARRKNKHDQMRLQKALVEKTKARVSPASTKSTSSPRSVEQETSVGSSSDMESSFSEHSEDASQEELDCPRQSTPPGLFAPPPVPLSLGGLGGSFGSSGLPGLAGAWPGAMLPPPGIFMAAPPPGLAAVSSA